MVDRTKVQIGFYGGHHHHTEKRRKVEEIELVLVQGSNLTEKIKVPSSLRVLPDGEKPAKGHGVMRVMTAKDGDKRIVWDNRDLAQIQDAKFMFDECVEKGLVPYRVGLDGKATAEVMDEFDPDAEEVIFLPVVAIRGGSL
jgi:hypothetical protein